MAAVPESGFLLIADITGYTAYLARGEIEHAPTIAGDLLETVIGRLEPPFRLAKFEGDAAFLWVEDGRAEGSLLLDAIEAAYVAFRRRLRSITQATTCECNACQRAPQLDLKFFVHHGQYVRSRIAGRDELAGASIIIVHRLLKGATAAKLHSADGSASGFAVFSADSLGKLGVEPAALGLAEGSESIEHLGEVVTFTQDLEDRWQAETALRRLGGGVQEPIFDVTVDVAAPASATWAHLTSPALRPGWEGLIRIEETAPDGRRGIGTTSRCVTGVLATLEEIVDWQPFEHAGYRVTVPDLGPIETTYDLSERADRHLTTIRHRWVPAGNRAIDVETRHRLERDRLAALERLRLNLVSTSTKAEEEVST
jgi:uncharacterized protein DUF2652/polyketide cyclase/dehydrase/lipid transport protein